MKKVIIILTVVMCLFSINVNAVNLAEMTEIFMKQNKIPYEDDDLSGISTLQNRKNIKNPQLISSAIKNGILVAKNGLVNENATEYTPLTDALIKKYIIDSEYRFITGGYVELERNKKISFNDDTFYVTENTGKKDLNYTDTYTCIVNRDNDAVFVWKTTDIMHPALYRVKLYWAESQELIVTEIYQKQFDLWIRQRVDNFLALDASQVSISEDFILKNLDEYVYVFADDYGEKIVVKGIAE